MTISEKIKYFYEVASSSPDRYDEVDDYVSTDCAVRVGETSIPVGVEGMRQHLIDVRKTYPDMKLRVIRQFVDHDHVISEVMMEGTHLGEWLGIKPTGKKLSIAAVNIDKIKEGKIIEHGGAANVFDIFWSEKIIRAWNN
ncbi:MAG TPA: ester cyclase [Syntrophales bacterium]|nr:ester cyclase [Syntrophales bacterium]